GGREGGALWLAVGRPELTEALAPLAGARRAEGFRTVVSTEPVAKAISGAPRRPRFILLVGDYEAGKENAPWYVPAKRLKLYRWQAEQRRDYASDAAWGDLDSDGVPDVPVGRIPARTPEDVELVCAKILAFERQPPAESDLRVPVWLGEPDFPPPLNKMATGLFMDYVERYAPPWSCLWVTTSDVTTPFCGWPPDKPAIFTRELRRGGALAFVSGHGREGSFFSMRHRGRHLQYTAASARGELSKGPPTPPLVFITCYAGSYGWRSPCMAESFLFFPGGPVATIGATTESHPLTNAFTSLSLVQALAGGQAPSKVRPGLTSVGGGQTRLGKLWLESQRRMVGMRDPAIEQLLSDVEGKLEGRLDVAKLKRDQVLMYAVLGDPATRLRLPGRLEASVARTASGWRWKVVRPPGATRLVAGVRPAGSSSPRATGRLERKRANELLEKANARFGFAPLPAPPEGAPWEGVVGRGDASRGSSLRLVATGPGLIRVAVLKLE
ncbi:MAG: C25 family cysteine peptidase, partial [Planctomycetota bacterium]